MSDLMGWLAPVTLILCACAAVMVCAYFAANVVDDQFPTAGRTVVLGAFFAVLLGVPAMVVSAWFLLA